LHGQQINTDHVEVLYHDIKRDPVHCLDNITVIK